MFLLLLLLLFLKKKIFLFPTSGHGTQCLATSYMKFIEVIFIALMLVDFHAISPSRLGLHVINIYTQTKKLRPFSMAMYPSTQK